MMMVVMFVVVGSCGDTVLDNGTSDGEDDEEDTRDDVGGFGTNAEDLEEPQERDGDVEGANDGRSEDKHQPLDLDGDQTKDDEEHDEHHDKHWRCPVVGSKVVNDQEVQTLGHKHSHSSSNDEYGNDEELPGDDGTEDTSKGRDTDRGPKVPAVIGLIKGITEGLEGQVAEGHSDHEADDQHEELDQTVSSKADRNAKEHQHNEHQARHDLLLHGRARVIVSKNLRSEACESGPEREGVAGGSGSRGGLNVRLGLRRDSHDPFVEGDGALLVRCRFSERR